MLKLFEDKGPPPIIFWGGLFNRRHIAWAILALLCISTAASALEPQFKYVKSDHGNIQTEIAIIDSLPQELIAYINKGVPVSFEYRLELWREKEGWFDVQAAGADISIKVRYDTWEKQYSVVQTSKALTIENELDGERETIDLLRSTNMQTLELNDTSGVYYLYGSLTIRTMSFSNYKEVESWLKGGVSDVKKPQLQDAPDRVGEFVFNMAMKMSGLKDIVREFGSGRFTIGELPLIAPVNNR